MKWYDVVDFDESAHPFVADSADLKGFDAEQFRRGRQVRSWDPNAWYRATKPEYDGEPDDILGEHLYIPVYSARLREALRSAGIGEIQYLSVKVIRPDGSEIPGYAIANILSLVPALDVAETRIVQRFPLDFPNPNVRGKIEDIRGVALRAHTLEGHDIIRLAESPLRVFVSDRFREIFRRRKLTGYAFHRIRVV